MLSIAGYFSRGQTRGAENHAENIPDVVTRWSAEPLDRATAAGPRRVRLAALEAAHPRAVGRAAQGRHGREVHPRITVNQEPPVGRKLEGMGAVAPGQHDEPAAVEVHAAVVDKIGIMARGDAAGVKPDLASAAVHPVDAAHHRVARGVVKVEVIPAVRLVQRSDGSAPVRRLAAGASTRRS